MMNTLQFTRGTMFGMKWNNNNIKGFTIVEIMVVIAVVIAVFAAVLGFFVFEAKIASRGRMKLTAISLAQEAIEAVRNFRDNTTWTSTGIGVLSIGADYHPASASTGWDIVSGEETINEFTRKIIFNKVYRDTNDDISSSGDEDPNTRKVTSMVIWDDRWGAASESLTTYITNWRE